MKNWSNLASIVYKRTYARHLGADVSRPLENWPDTVERVIAGNVRNHNVSAQEIERLRYYMMERKGIPAGRGLWYSGSPGHDRLGGVALANCWALTADDWKNFVIAQDLLMLGGGVGMSVEHRFVSLLPKVRKDVKVVNKNTSDADFIVPDSREGWDDLLYRVLESYFVTGKSFSYSTTCVRPAGEPIRGIGGKSSGPGPLIKFIDKLSKILNNRSGKHIRPIDASDIICATGEMVVSGNVRRSAIIILGDSFDKEYLKAKRWDLGNIPTERGMANFSVVCDDIEDLHPLFWKTYEEGEPFGIVNRKNIQKFGRMGEIRNDTAYLVNPSLRAGTRVLTSHGIVPIESLQDKEFLVTNLDGQISSSSCWLSGKGKRLWEIELESGQKYYATPEHKWPVSLNGRFLKVETSLLAEGDELPILRSTELPVSGGDSSYEEGFFLGWLYGDGWVTERKDNGKIQYGIIVSAKDKEAGIDKKITQYLTSLTGKQYEGCENDGNLEFNTANALVHKRMTSLGVGHKSKGLPKCLWTGTDALRKGFVDGLISSDGCVIQTGGCEKINNGSVQVNWSSSHKLLADEFSELLGFYGIKTFKSTRILEKASFPNGKDYDRTYTSNVLRITGGENVVHFRNTFHLSIPYKQEKLEGFYKNIVPSKHGLNKIVSVKETDIYEDVWDVTVRDETHCFQLSHCVTGNCAEATLENGENCNLQEIALPNLSSVEEFEEVACLMHRYGKRVTCEKIHHAVSAAVIKKNRRVGTGITGCLEAPQFFNPEVLDRVYNAIQEENRTYSKELNINESVRTTVNKPSGTASKILDVRGEGLHAGYSRFMIQRVRFSANDGLIPLLREAGHPMEPVVRFDGSLDHGTLVVDFYIHTPEQLPCADDPDFTTWKQLDILKMSQKHWADQAVSVTVYYKKHEIPELKKWLGENLQYLKTISCLCHNDHGFKQAPKEAMTQEQYEKLSAKIRPIGQDLVSEGDLESMECAGGACPVR